MNDLGDSGARHPIQVVVRRTGLSADVLRAWERRYEAVVPERTETGRRVYSDLDIEKLVLLRRATQGGRSIGQVANMGIADLKDLIEEDQSASLPRPRVASRDSKPTTSGDAVETILEDLLVAVERLDDEALEASLARATNMLSSYAVIEQVLVPFMRTVGDRWRSGRLRIAHEHLATALVRSFMGELMRIRSHDETAPRIVVATPARQNHELGAMIAAAAAAAEGWRVTYLGPNLPAEEIAGAANNLEARALALSITFPPDDPQISLELRRLRKLLDGGVAVVVGGQAASSYQDTLREIDAALLSDVGSLRATLEGLRIQAA